MSEHLTINATLRETRGKGFSRRLRLQGKIPANLYNSDHVGSSPLELESKLLSKAWKSDKHFMLHLNGSSRLVKIQELQVEPATRKALHCDLIYV